MVNGDQCGPSSTFTLIQSSERPKHNTKSSVGWLALPLLTDTVRSRSSYHCLWHSHPQPDKCPPLFTLLCLAIQLQGYILSLTFFNHCGIHECSHTCHPCQSCFPGPQITWRPGRVMNNSISFASQENIASPFLWKCRKCTWSKKKLKFLKLFISGTHKVRSTSMFHGKPPFTEVHCCCLHGNQQSENIMADFWICLIYAWDGSGTWVRHAEKLDMRLC